METEVQMASLSMAYTIPIDLVVDVVAIMVPQVEVMVAPQMMCMELVQIAPLPQSLEDDIDITIDSKT